jgi:hypothetical protein
MTGNTASERVNGEGKPVYKLLWNGQLREGSYAVVTSGLSSDQIKLVRRQGILNPVWNGNLFEGRNVYGQQLYTTSNMFLDENLKAEFVVNVLGQLENEGVDLAEIKNLWDVHENGQQMTDEHEFYRLRFNRRKGWLGRHPNELNKLMLESGYRQDAITEDAKNEFIEKEARKAGAEQLINNTVITTHGAYIDMAYGLADVLGFTPLWDVRQDYDHLNELWNKMMTTYAYGEKYEILPAVTRRLVQSYIRTILAWKRRDVDPVLVSMYGNPKELTAAWMNPLNPETAPIIPALTLTDGRKLTDLQKSAKEITLADGSKVTEGFLFNSITSTIEAVFYTKSEFRIAEASRRDQANHLVLLAGGAPNKAEATAEAYFDQYIAKFRTMAMQEFPSTRNEAAAKVLALMDVRRLHLDMVNFKPLLGALGYKNIDLNGDEYVGALGLNKLIALRSNRQWLVCEVQKWFKYMSKYPEMAVAEGRLLAKIVPALNNALNPFYENLLGGAPDQFKTLNADQIGEAVAKGVVNLLFIGKRKKEEAWKYLQQIAEPLLEAGDPMGYMSGQEQRQNYTDIVMSIDAFAEKAMTMATYEWIGGEGEHGSRRKYLEISYDDPKKERLAVTALRKAGFLVTYPSKAMPADHDLKNMLNHGQLSMSDLPEGGLAAKAEVLNNHQPLIKKLQALGWWKQKKPYVTWGIQPIFFDKGAELGANGELVVHDQEHDVLGLYGHRGKEVLMTIILLEFLQDQLRLTEYDAQTTLVEMGSFGDKEKVDEIWANYKKVREEEQARLGKLEELEEQKKQKELTRDTQ